jgi:hypothetical protein
VALRWLANGGVGRACGDACMLLTPLMPSAGFMRVQLLPMARSRSGGRRVQVGHLPPGGACSLASPTATSWRRCTNSSTRRLHPSGVPHILSVVAGSTRWWAVSGRARGRSGLARWSPATQRLGNIFTPR